MHFLGRLRVRQLSRVGGAESGNDASIVGVGFPRGLRGVGGLLAVVGACVALGSLAVTSAEARSGLASAFGRGHGGPSLYGASYKPSKYCPSNHTCFSKAKWRKWGSSRAVAVAKGSTYYPGATHATEGKATFVFKDPRHICGSEYFTKATWRYHGKHGSTTSSLLSAGSGCYWTGA